MKGFLLPWPTITQTPTVPTMYHLYFESISLETILDIYDADQSRHVTLSSVDKCP